MTQILCVGVGGFLESVTRCLLAVGGVWLGRMAAQLVT
jgi:hypothetical protein